ncbi:hypothetical protein [Paraburkholderia phenoliruptrix]|uniref:hypothetical protein n=1 Tax=Paraburkholderia phenoliruptrix TaxID=252970 RepID=UPI001C4FFCB8|nr:hypothetical protein [Paraburkholderia phenoliruptrix]MBW0450882.1 hypothetical protein [Paraburkholderia phenoliruptrix]MBW9100975.1 hypothetical protein [Paraburkholderia phenoliruptrix]
MMTSPKAVNSGQTKREAQQPIATIHRDGSMFHTQWHRVMPELFKLDVYAEPITEPEHSALYIAKKLTGSTADAAFVQAHINQAVSEAMDRATSTQASAAATDTVTCKACNGNDGDMPCAYPEGHANCLRNTRAAAPQGNPESDDGAQS